MRAAVDPALRASSRHLSVDEADEFARSPDIRVRIALAGNRALPARVAERMHWDRDPGVKRALASNQAIPSTLLNRLVFSEAEVEVATAALGNPTLPEETMQSVAWRGEEWQREALAGNLRLPGRIADILAFDPIVAVRRQVARNQSAPAEVLRRLAYDTDLTVAANVARNHASSSDAHWALALRDIPVLTRALQDNPRARVALGWRARKVVVGGAQSQELIQINRHSSVVHEFSGGRADPAILRAGCEPLLAWWEPTWTLRTGIQRWLVFAGDQWGWVELHAGEVTTAALLHTGLGEYCVRSGWRERHVGANTEVRCMVTPVLASGSLPEIVDIRAQYPVAGPARILHGLLQIGGQQAALWADARGEPVGWTRSGPLYALHRFEKAGGVDAAPGIPAGADLWRRATETIRGVIENAHTL